MSNGVTPKKRIIIYFKQLKSTFFITFIAFYKKVQESELKCCYCIGKKKLYKKIIIKIKLKTLNIEMLPWKVN